MLGLIRFQIDRVLRLLWTKMQRKGLEEGHVHVKQVESSWGKSKSASYLDLRIEVLVRFRMGEDWRLSPSDPLAALLQ